MKSRLTLPLLVVLTIAAFNLWLQGAVPDVPTGQWMAGPAVAQPREGAVSVALEDGRVLLIGGRSAGGPVATVEVVDEDGSISLASPMALARVGHTAVRLSDGSVLVAGGTTVVATEQGTAEVPTASAEIFAPAANVWFSASPLNAARTGHTATALADGRVLVAGGTGEQGALDSMEVFEPLDAAFRVAGLLSAARVDHAAALAGPTQVVVVGGQNADGVLDTADLVDVDAGTVAQLLLTTSRAGASATALLNGRVLVVGGTNGANDLASAEILDPTSGTSVAVAEVMAQPRRDHQATKLAHNNTVLIVGGTSNGAVVPTAEQFVPWTGHFQMTSSPATARTAAVVSSTSTDGVAVLAAGKAGNGTLIGPTEFYGFATLKTDKDDYIPGNTVYMTGEGWQPGETVTLLLEELPEVHAARSFMAIADAQGRIVNSELVLEEHHFGMRFNLTATGAGSSARTYFTDARQFTAAISPTTSAVGVSTTYSVLVTNTSTSGEAVGCVQIGVPVGGGTPGSLSVVAQDNPGGVRTWSAPTLSASTIQTLRTGAGNPNDIDPNGTITVTFTTTATTSGTKNWNVLVFGQTNCSGQPYSISGSQPQVVVNGSTTTTITSDNPDPSVVGQAVAIAYSVTPSGAGTPTGSVTVSDGTQSCVGTVAGGSCSITFASGGAKSLTATYSGDANFSGSASSPATSHTVSARATTTTVALGAAAVVVGQTTSVSVTVTDVDPAGTKSNPSGTVTLASSDVSDTFSGACTLAPNSTDKGVCSVNVTAHQVGSNPHVITAAFLATSSHSTSQGTQNLTVNKAGTTTTINSDSPDPSVVGQPVTVAYGVVATAPASGTPTGNVTVGDGTDSCTGTAAAGTCSITFTTAGTKALTATYVGDTNFNGSASTPTTPHQVDKADTATTITSDTPDPSMVGQPVVINYGVAVVTPGAGTPTGNVTVSDGTNSCTGTAAAGTCSITFTSAGAKALTASYEGDTKFNGSSSTPTTPHQVDKASTTTTIASDTPDPSLVGQAVVVGFSVTVNSPGSGVPTGDVTVSDGSDSCTGTVAAGTCSITFTSAGAHPLTATYDGNANFNGSASASEPHAVNKADTTTAITTDTPDPSVVGQAVTVNYSVAVNAPGAGTPTGNVTVSDGTDSCTASVATAQCSITFTTAGPHPLTASYAGDSNFNGSTSASEPHTVNKANTTAAITSDTPDPSVVGQGVVVNFNVTVNAPGAGSPTGNVTVSDGTDSCIGTVAAGTCTITFTNAGAKSLTATYAGDSDFNGSASSPVTPHQVNKADTTAAITSDTPDPSVVGEVVTINYNVSVTAPGAGTPAGNVTVSDGTQHCTGTVAAGQCTIAFSTAGAHPVTATFAGDANFNGSVSAAEPHQVNKANTTSTVTSDTPDPSVTGQPVTISYTVAVNSPGAGTATGNVTISDGTLNCTDTVAAGSCSITFTSAGPRTLVATYDGDSNFNGSTSVGAGHTVNKASTQTTVTSSPNPSLLNQPVTFTATVTAVAPGAGTRTGVVTFKDGATTLGTGAVNAGGQATLTTPSLAAGSHTITAIYSGDGNFNTSTAATSAPQVVNYTFTGFFSPVDNMPTVNSAKAGAAIPTKWRIVDTAGVGVSDPGSFTSFTSYAVSCGVWATAITDPVPEDFSGNSGLLYQGNGNWQWNWKTPKEYVGQCRVASGTLSDGTTHEYAVKFK